MKILGKIVKAIGGYSWVLAVIGLGTFMFMNMDMMKKFLSNDMGLHVSENWTGGGTAYGRVFPSYTLKVHEPVWDGINHDGETGFIQVDWLFNDGEPHAIENQEISFRKAGAADFRISFDPQSRKVDFTAYSPNIIAVMDKTSLAWFVRYGFKDGRGGLFLYHGFAAVRIIVKR